MKELCVTCAETVGGCDNPEACPIFQTVSALEDQIEKMKNCFNCSRDRMEDGSKYCEVCTRTSVHKTDAQLTDNWELVAS
ncbi:MAG: hypothetical protein ACYTEQ_01015 [Planctomycetota bacterium]|jgi:hypothetical protein